MNLEQFLGFFTLGAILGSIVLGLLIGMLYAWDSSSEPFTLWGVGMAFVVLLGLYNAAVTPFGWERNVARGILWTFVCLAIAIGKRLRRWWELKRSRKELDELREELNGH